MDTALEKRKTKNTGWVFPVWLLAVLYIWCGALYPFLFGSHDENGGVPTVSIWLSMAYILLLAAGLILFRNKRTFCGIFALCRSVQTVGVLFVYWIDNLYLAVVSVGTLVPFGGMLQYDFVLLRVGFILISGILAGLGWYFALRKNG